MIGQNELFTLKAAMYDSRRIHSLALHKQRMQLANSWAVWSRVELLEEFHAVAAVVLVHVDDVLEC